MRRPRRARQLHTPDLRHHHPHAPAALHHARRPRQGLDRGSLQSAGPRPTRSGRAQARRHGQPHRPHRQALRRPPLALMGSEIPFPFRARPSTIVVAGMPTGTIACMPLLDEWGIASRLASRAGFPGCYEGFVTELADEWLKTLAPPQLAEIELFACGPTPMLAAAAAVARRYGVPCQASLEEFMACAVGGCAGCTVLVRTPEGEAMKRV